MPVNVRGSKLTLLLAFLPMVRRARARGVCRPPAELRQLTRRARQVGVEFRVPLIAAPNANIVGTFGVVDGTFSSPELSICNTISAQVAADTVSTQLDIVYTVQSSCDPATAATQGSNDEAERSTGS